METSSNEQVRVHLHTIMEIASGSFQRSVDEVVVLFTFFVTDDLAPNERHLCVQHTYGWEDVSSLLIQQGKERLMEIQQHDGVVLMELQYSGRASLSTMEVEEVLEREKEATKGQGVQV